MKVFLKYSFIFDPAELWPHKADFESDIASMFKKIGIGAEIVRSSNEDEDEKMLLLFKLPDIPTPEVKQKSPQAKLAQMKKKRGFGGKFKKDNG